MSFINIFGTDHLVKEIKRGHVIGCAHCGGEFKADDRAFAITTGKCPHCQRTIKRGLTQ